MADRRGRYGPDDGNPGCLAPSEEDWGWRDQILADSQLASSATKLGLADSAMACRIQLRDLTSGRQLAVDEMKLVATVTQKLGQTLERMKLTIRMTDDEEEA